MDQMDIEHTVDIPDTPDRLTTQRIKVSDSAEGIRRSSTLCHSGQQKLMEESTKDHPVLIDSGSRRLSLRPQKITSNSGNSRHPITSSPLSVASPSSSRNAYLLRKGVTEKKPSYLSHDSAHTQHLQTVRPSCISKSSSQDNSFVDLTEGNLHRPAIGKASRSRVQKNNPADFRKRSGLANSASSSHGVTKFSDSSCYASEETGNTNRVGLSIDFGEGVDVVGNIQNEPGNCGFLSLDPIAPARVNKQKRLVRNGCISPNNIVNARRLAGKDIGGSADIANNNRGSMAISAPVSTDIRELVAEDNDPLARKGKGVISHPCPSTGSDLINKKFHDSVKDVGTGDYTRRAGKSIEESGGWRSTHNHTREMNISSRRGLDAPRCSSLHHDNHSERKKKGICAGTGDNCPKDQNLFSSEHGCSQSLRESISHPGIRLGQLKGPRSSADTLIKRQKQGSNLSSRGESSISVSNDPEVVFLRSSKEATNPESTSNCSDYFQQIVEVDEISPQLRHNALDEDARARQVEADEILARELQEQLYNEVPAFGVGEVDEHIPLALQHQDDLNHGFSRARHHVLNARGSVMSNSHRRSQSRPSSAPRRGSLARGSTLGRMTRLRSRFPGQPRTLVPSRERTSMFPADMDVEMRMHILGALEEFSDMGTTTAMHQDQRDFNENDYEMLLALDENNDRHCGMPIHHINGLPQSTVQRDDFEEACAICLDTPTIGDTIRHLPCLHKFHKDCIDPWLRRRTSCPVCKSSIT